VTWSSQPGNPPPTRSVRVVLVDDVEDVLRMVRTALRLHGGFDVVGQARSGLHAIELAAQLKPDVVVLDLGLPDIAGQEVLTRIRQVAAGTQVVVLSASAPTDSAWFEEHAAGYVLKDQDLDHLVGLLEHLGPRSDDVRVLDLPQDPAAAGRARELVRGALLEWGLEALVDDALLVVSELVGNAVTHAASSCQVSISRASDSVRIEVTDRGEGTPQPQPYDRMAEGGRGLVLIGAMSSAWGVEHVQDGKKVWAEIVVG
jgi:CheY-like chemotaxis protein/anti-sigma regulatory factor (Ser/Thr protein kinase)